MPIYEMYDWDWVMERMDERALRVVDAVSCATRARAQHGLEEPQVVLISYTGKVLATRERNGYDDSDFYALVWTGERIAEVCYATTRAWTYGNGAIVDATDAVQDAAEAWLAERLAECFAQQEREAAREIKVGRLVIVARGRKVPQGHTGVVTWLGPGRYKRARARVALDGGGGAVWIDAGNLDVLNPEALEQTPEQVRRAALAAAQRARRAGAWRIPYYLPGERATVLAA